MIDMQHLDSALVVLAILVGAAIALSVTHRGQTPRGGTRRDLPPQPVPDDDDARQLVLR